MLHNIMATSTCWLIFYVGTIDIIIDRTWSSSTYCRSSYSRQRSILDLMAVMLSTPELHPLFLYRRHTVIVINHTWSIIIIDHRTSHTIDLHRHHPSIISSSFYFGPLPTAQALRRLRLDQMTPIISIPPALAVSCWNPIQHGNWYC